MARTTDDDIFVAVARATSFRRAADALGVTKSTVSRAVSRLEAHLGAALVVRDQRAFRLTEAGTAYAEFAKLATRALDQGAQAVAALAGTVAGAVRISAPPALGQSVVVGACAAFARAHPYASVDLVLTDDLLSMTSRPIDLVVRAGPRLADSDLKVRRLARAPMVAVAAPALVSSIGPADVWPSIEFAWPGSSPPLPPAPASLRTRLRVNDYLAVRAAVLAGHGVGVLSELLVAADLRAGRLQRVFEGWRLPTANYWALYPASAPMPPKARAMLGHLVEAFAPWS